VKLSTQAPDVLLREFALSAQDFGDDAFGTEDIEQIF
jgi:hypothetical protein